MKRKYRRPEQIVKLLRKAEAKLAQGVVPRAIRLLITHATEKSCKITV